MQIHTKVDSVPHATPDGHKILDLYPGLSHIRTREDGTPYFYDEQVQKKLSKLIRNECCCFVDGGCVAIDDDCCPQMLSLHICCRWFQDCVLPLAPPLEAEIFHDKDLRSCSECGTKFIAASPRSKYCPKCAARIRKEKNAGYKRKSRQAKETDILSSSPMSPRHGKDPGHSPNAP